MIDWVVDEASLLRSPMGTISGTVLLRVDGIGFPEERWSDFPLPVTVAWLEELFQIASGNRGKRDVYSWRVLSGLS